MHLLEMNTEVRLSRVSIDQVTQNPWYCTMCDLMHGLALEEEDLKGHVMSVSMSGQLV